MIRDTEFVFDIFICFYKIWIVKLQSGNIDGDCIYRKASIEAPSDKSAYLFKYILVKWWDKIFLFKDGNEFIRRNDQSFICLPAYQRFGLCCQTCLQVDLGLKVNEEFFIFQWFQHAVFDGFFITQLFTDTFIINSIFSVKSCFYSFTRIICTV